jgi:monothiol glutaredoxin
MPSNSDRSVSQQPGGGDQEIQAEVVDLINTEDLVLFMKGTPGRPQCGFSQRAIGVLQRYQSDFATVDVLGEDLPAYREALEAHSGWETIPQIYAEGEFIGGSDILVELHENGDLAERLPD